MVLNFIIFRKDNLISHRNMMRLHFQAPEFQSFMEIFIILFYSNMHYITECVLCALSCSVVSDSLWPHGLQRARLFCPWGFSRQEYWRGLPCPSPGDLPTQGLNPGVLHCRQILYPLSYQGSLEHSSIHEHLLLFLSLSALLSLLHLILTDFMLTLNSTSAVNQDQTP